jgi:hypothetical protein
VHDDNLTATLRVGIGTTDHRAPHWRWSSPRPIATGCTSV